MLRNAFGVNFQKFLKATCDQAIVQPRRRSTRKATQATITIRATMVNVFICIGESPPTLVGVSAPYIYLAFQLCKQFICRGGPPWPPQRMSTTLGWPRRATPTNTSQRFHGTSRTQKYPKIKKVISAIPGMITIQRRRGSKREASPMNTGNASNRCRGNDR